MQTEAFATPWCFHSIVKCYRVTTVFSPPPPNYLVGQPIILLSQSIVPLGQPIIRQPIIRLGQPIIRSPSGKLVHFANETLTLHRWLVVQCFGSQSKLSVMQIDSIVGNAMTVKLLHM